MPVEPSQQSALKSGQPLPLTNCPIQGETMKCNSCSLCNKQGLPILLTRYAIAPNNSNAPAIHGNFTPPSIGLGAETHYTQRLLRQGYVYQYNEATKQWKGHIVLNDGYLYPFEIDEDDGPGSPFKGDAAEKSKPCEPEKDGAVAGCVCIPYSELGVLWFTFSDVEWTKAVWQKHNDDAAWREKHMRKIDAKAWRNGAAAPHATGINDVAQHVAEYTPGVIRKNFAYSHAEFIDRPRYVDFSPLAAQIGAAAPAPFEITHENQIVSHLNKTPEGVAFYQQVLKYREQTYTQSVPSLLANRKEGSATWLFSGLARLDPNNKLPADKKGMILALNDPAGITTDLAALINHQFNEFDRPHERELLINAAITGFRNAVESQAETKLIDNANLQKARIEIWSGEGRIPAEEQARLDSLTTQSKLDETRKNAWKKYEFKDVNAPETDANRRYDEARRAAFAAKYNTEMEAFVKASITPLGIAHAQWLKSIELLNGFTCNFDDSSIESGLVYSTVVSSCIGHTQNLPESGKVYADWYAGTTQDPSNLLARSFILNQNKFADIVTKLDELGEKYAKDTVVALALTKLWEESIGQVKDAFSGALQGQADNLLQRLAGQVVGVAIKSAQGGTIKQIMIAMGLVGKFAVVRANVTGTLQDVAHSIAETALVALKQDPVRNRSVLTQARTQVAAIFTEGGWEIKPTHPRSLINPNAPGRPGKRQPVLRYSTAIIIEEAKLAQVSKELFEGAEAAGRVGEVINVARITKFGATPESLDKLNERYWSQVVRFNRGVTSSLLSTVFLAFQAIGLKESYKAIESASNKDKSICEPLSKFAGAALGTISSAASVGEKSIKLFSARLGKAASDKWAKRLSGASKWLGVPAAVIMGGWDIVNMVEAGQKKQIALAIAYGGSVILSGVAIWMILTPATIGFPIILAVVLATVVVTTVISLLKDNDMQEWLSRCLYGKGGDKYAGEIAEKKALEEVAI
jgi:hypothetical protein